MATAIDSVFDIGSNALLWWLHRKSVALDTSKWPVGGARLETIGNIIYGKCFTLPVNVVVMFCLSRLSVSSDPVVQGLRSNFSQDGNRESHRRN